MITRQLTRARRFYFLGTLAFALSTAAAQAQMNTPPFAIALGWPTNGKVVIKSLAANSALYKNEIGKIELLGSAEKINFTRDDTGLTVNVPGERSGNYAIVLKITPKK